MMNTIYSFVVSRSVAQGQWISRSAMIDPPKSCGTKSVREAFVVDFWLKGRRSFASQSIAREEESRSMKVEITRVVDNDYC